RLVARRRGAIVHAPPLAWLAPHRGSSEWTGGLRSPEVLLVEPLANVLGVVVRRLVGEHVVVALPLDVLRAVRTLFDARLYPGARDVGIIEAPLALDDV